MVHTHFNAWYACDLRLHLTQIYDIENFFLKHRPLSLSLFLSLLNTQTHTLPLSLSIYMRCICHLLLFEVFLFFCFHIFLLLCILKVYVHVFIRLSLWVYLSSILLFVSYFCRFTFIFCFLVAKCKNAKKGKNAKSRG